VDDAEGHRPGRASEIDAELAALDGELVDEAEVATALADFNAVWDCLAPREQARVIELLVERVEYDGQAGKIAITFRPSGIKALAGELANRKEEAA
jgi:site-specific DNA recombinase